MGSLRSWWMLWAGATLLWGLTQEASVDPKNSGGEEFLTAFLQNYNLGYSKAYLYLLLSSLSDNLTSVSILSQVDGTSQKVTVGPGQSVMVNITAKAEMVGSNTFQRAVVVHSDRTISVQAINAKPNTADVTQLWPVRALGTEYFVLTPSSASSQNLKEFAVVAGAAGASVSIQLKGSVTFQRKSYSAGNVLSVTLDPYQVAQVQSTANLSGSKVTASSPVAVLSGHSCAQKNTNCNHVVEQLLPTSAWGTYYVVPPLSFQTRSDLVYVVASQATKLTYNLGGTNGSRELQAGNVAEFEIQQSQPLYLSADVGIQVLLFGTGTTKDGVTYDPHLVLIPDVAAYCPAYVVNSVPNSKCVALVVAPTKAAGELTIDGQRLGANLTWAVVPGSEFSYAEVDLGTTDSIHVAEAATNFGLLTFGLNQDVSFGTAAACGRTLQTQGKPSCEGKQCGPKQLCKVLDGQARCLADSAATCRAQGDPHYTTFDGRRYDMMGTCLYSMAELCSDDQTLPAFSVETKNEHRGSPSVSYVGLVTVRAYSHAVSLARGEVGFARIDSQRSRLPASLAEGHLRVYQSGTRAMVELDFGLVVTYDWDAQLALSLPVHFQGQVCGLCGNYNGDPTDDFLTPDWEQASDAVEFASSWKLDDEDYLCEDGCQNNCPSCTPDQAQHYEGSRLCGMLTQLDGPFAVCRDALDPQPFLKECVYDLCVASGDRASLCRALSTYAQACLEFGISVGNWRLPASCPLSCPANSRYELCGPACPASCNPAAVPSNCSARPCVEGCVCLPGFVASGGACVAASSCGCNFEGRPLAPGQEVWADEYCRRRCTCDAATQQVRCSDTQGCPAGERCRVQNGLLGCYPDRFGSCQASGDPHYVSFDGRRFDFMGTCTYLLAGSCGQAAGLPAFRVLVENEHRGSQTGSYTRAVRVEARGVKVAVRREYPGRVLVDGILQYLPFQVADGQVQVFRQGQDAVVRTDFGLTVTYNWNAHVTAKVPSSYAGALCGLCGNFNGDPADDLALRGGGQAANALAFGKSWQEETRPGCGAAEPGDCPKLDTLVAQQLQSKKECGILADPSGPFRECHHTLDPQGAVRDCVYDRCLLPGQSGPLCDALASYAAACQAAGATVHPWRSEQLCSMQCPPNSHYELCADTCSLGCWALSAPPQCPDSCAEGCQCDSGFLNDGQACVPIQKCGCYHNGVYYELGRTVLIDSCQQQCVCHAGKGLLCQNHSCNPEQVCQPSGGVLSCVTKDPCHGVTCQPQETCQEKNGQGVCVPNYEATCWLWGDPHYHSFDGWNFDFQGTCNYVLASTSCPGSSAQGLTSFTVTTKNENRGNPSVSCVRLVTVTILNTNISIHKGEIGKVRVNGVLTALPVSVAGGQLSVTQGVSRAVLATDFGLRVSYDWDWRVEVTLPSSYHGVVCGLCGNMDRNPSNDQAFPNGTLAPSIPVWGGSWRVPGWDPLCWDECQGSCPTCAEDRLEEYRGPGFCGPLAPGSGGPFAACHAHVAPDSFFKGCVLDVCLGGGAQNILCQALAAYATACQAAGIVIKDWRTQAGCELSCPENSHYELCGPPCPASCPSPAPPTASAPCEGPCTEGCQCDSGFVLSADRCVPLDGGCGCWANGTYHEAGSEFWADATCSQRCHCGPGGGSLVCKPASCGLGEECALLPSGQHGCHPISTAECQAWGDPHYITLDRHQFNFQGACDYLLSMPCHRLPPGVENFTVTVANEHRGSQAISYTRTVTLHIYGHSFTLSARWPRQLQVDGRLVALPFQLDSRLRAHLSGADVVVTTATAISLAFDGDNNVRLRVPAAYAGALCGLCGNYNQNPNDDLNAVGGNPDGWQVGGAEGCGECVPGPCPQPCTQEQQEPFGGPDACGVISAPDGPLAPCHSHVPPTQYFQACLLDACQAQGHPGGLCPAVATYVVACQAAGAQLGEWRRPDFCPLQCPAHSHYKLCGDSCPVSCPSLSAPEGCESTCREGCFCDAGFVLSGDTCVPVGQCGCLHEGRYYPLGKDFYPGPECERRCECGPGGQVSCQEGAACGPYEECRLQDGVQACRPTGCGRCLASGGVHYITLDGRAYDLHGSCSYILAQVCHPQPGDEDFTIVLENNAAGDPQRLVVTVAGQVVGLARGPQVTVDGEAVALPVAVGHVRVTAEGRNMILQTTKELRLLFDGDAYILISVPSPFRDRLCGLCGNFNGNWNDDFVLPSGAMAPSVDAFGAAWRAPGSSQGCGEGCGPQGCPLCSAEETAPYESLEACGRLQDAKGPFSACHAALSPSEYFRQCVYDLCAQKGNSAALCRSLSAYTVACQAAGVAVKPWRTDSFCPLQCPAHSHYSICTRSCQGSCAALSGLTGCTTRCFEGCECDDRFLLSQGVCIPVQDCGCTHDGRYLPANSSLLTSDCSERCSCSSSTGQTCQAASCPPGRVCEVQAGVRDCWVSRGLCSLSVDANLTTFDGARSAVSSPGIYELSFRCPGLQETVPWYRVVADVWPCNGKAAVLGHVHIFFQDGLVTVTRNKGVWVNGLQVDLPAEVLTSVSVSRNPDGSVLVQQKAGVRVQLGTDGQLAVVVGDDHAGMLCGACGNFDADQTNDGHDSQKETTLENWRAQDFSPCQD
ncbi:IgGFc-binding protein isoform X2 [Monodon monoceros]|uniref:IgGFc-binding protein isoform X2 n=1 Tax=Monodon monoceros TaxID=40151 RepID=UPI0010F7D670|nr:IgGFc-binding protein isoform X2 [Monodon monoceros]